MFLLAQSCILHRLLPFPEKLTFCSLLCMESSIHPSTALPCVMACLVLERRDTFSLSLVFPTAMILRGKSKINPRTPFHLLNVICQRSHRDTISMLLTHNKRQKRKHWSKVGSGFGFQCWKSNGRQGCFSRPSSELTLHSFMRTEQLYFLRPVYCCFTCVLSFCADGRFCQCSNGKPSVYLAVYHGESLQGTKPLEVINCNIHKKVTLHVSAMPQKGFLSRAKLPAIVNTLF